MVMKSVTYIAGAAVAAMVAMAATPSHAAVDANGTFGFGITSGDIDLNTHDANLTVVSRERHSCFASIR